MFYRVYIQKSAYSGSFNNYKSINGKLTLRFKAQVVKFKNDRIVLQISFLFINKSFRICENEYVPFISM